MEQEGHRQRGHTLASGLAAFKEPAWRMANRSSLSRTMGSPRKQDPCRYTQESLGRLQRACHPEPCDPYSSTFTTVTLYGRPWPSRTAGACRVPAGLRPIPGKIGVVRIRRKCRTDMEKAASSALVIPDCDHEPPCAIACERMTASSSGTRARTSHDGLPGDPRPDLLVGPPLHFWHPREENSLPPAAL